MQRATETLKGFKTVQVDVKLTVEADDAHLLGNGEYRWHFKVAGPSRAYWRERGQEFWYTEPTLWGRGFDGKDERDFGKDEGLCIFGCILQGGMIARILIHFSWGFEYSKVAGMREERVGDRRYVVLGQSFKLSTPGSSDPEFTGGEVWIDAQTALIHKRTYATARGKVLKATEEYSNWKVDEPLGDELFRPRK